MEKCFLDQIKRRTWRSPFSEGLPSRWAGSCIQKQHRMIYWTVKDGVTYLNENNKPQWRPLEADSSLWGHNMQMEVFDTSLQSCLQDTITKVLNRTRSVVPRWVLWCHLSTAGLNLKKFPIASPDLEPSYPSPYKKYHEYTFFTVFTWKIWTCFPPIHLCPWDKLFCKEIIPQH